jgi:hypothetical protein
MATGYNLIFFFLNTYFNYIVWSMRQSESPQLLFKNLMKYVHIHIHEMHAIS